MFSRAEKLQMTKAMSRGPQRRQASSFGMLGFHPLSWPIGTSNLKRKDDPCVHGLYSCYQAITVNILKHKATANISNFSMHVNVPTNRQTRKDTHTHIPMYVMKFSLSLRCRCNCNCNRIVVVMYISCGCIFK